MRRIISGVKWACNWRQRRRDAASKKRAVDLANAFYGCLSARFGTCESHVVRLTPTQEAELKEVYSSFLAKGEAEVCEHDFVDFEKKEDDDREEEAR